MTLVSNGAENVIELAEGGIFLGSEDCLLCDNWGHTTRPLCFSLFPHKDNSKVVIAIVCV